MISGKTREQDKHQKAGLKKTILEIGVYFVLFFVCVFIIPKYVFSITIVDGDSMNPSLYDGELVVQGKIAARTGNLDRFDVVVFQPFEDNEDELYMKRIIGLPNETVQIAGGVILINGQPLEENYALDDSLLYAGIASEKLVLGEDEYFVLGDNRAISNDSRYPEIGKISRSQINGRLLVVFWPLAEFGSVD